VYRKLLGYVMFPVIAIRVGLGKTPALPHDEWAREDSAHIKEVEQITGHTAQKMRGMPTAKAFKFFSGMPLFSRLFEQMVANTAANIVLADPEIIIQFELPAELSFTTTPLGENRRKAVARRMAVSLERIIRRLPPGTKVAFHLCYGDLNRREFIPTWLQSNAAKVILVNAITGLSVWQEGWELAVIHDPLCDGRHDPKESAADYAAYDNLATIPAGALYAVGTLRAGFTVAQTTRVARIFEAKLAAAGGTRIALAPPCGDGRKPIDEVEKQYRIGCEAIRQLNDA
jgi:hypothetical protein